MTSVLQSFLTGRGAAQQEAINRQGLQERQFALGQRQQTAPLQQRQDEISLSDQEIGLATQRAQLLSNTLDAIGRASPDPQARYQIAQRAIPELQKFGLEIDPNEVTPEVFTDEGLAQLKAETTGFLSNPRESITALQQNIDTQAQALVGATNPETEQPFNLEEARQAVVLRQAGIVPRAGISARERVALDPNLAEKIGESEREIVNQVETGKQQAKTVANVIDESFKSINKIEGNIRNIDRAINALDRGARTGAVDQFLPSVTAASKELDNIQKELGLDVVGSVTFGALSKDELKLSLDVALPKGMNEPDLKEFLIRKRDAQRKLIGYLEDQIDFLEQGGTVGDWRKQIRSRSAQDGPPTITTQAQFDALPSGAVFLEDGVKYRKP